MNLRILLIAGTILFLAALQSCGEKVDRPDAILTEEQKRERAAQIEAPMVPNAPVPTGGVAHYTCPNGHPGSSAQGTCANCGATLVHNQAFHNQTPNTNNPTSEGEPPQNALGVWHYTCPNGHDGGSGSATPCPQCGATLVHNTVYHDNGANAGTIPVTDAGTIPVTDVGTPPAPTEPEPPMNEAGVWHYICPNGHEGGAGSAVGCRTCAATMIHNTAYHE